MPHRGVRNEPRKPEDEADTTYVYSRAEDRSFWWRLDAFYSKYRVLFGALLFILIGAGFGFRTPMQVFGEIHSQVDTLKAQIKTAGLERTELQKEMQSLIRLECIRSIRAGNAQDLALAGIDCSALEIR